MSELQNQEVELTEDAGLGEGETVDAVDIEAKSGSEGGKKKKAANENETKGEKFVRIGTPRVNKAMKAISSLQPLANKDTYEYTPDQVEKMFDALQNALDEARAAFASKEKAAKSGFSFD